MDPKTFGRRLEKIIMKYKSALPVMIVLLISLACQAVGTATPAPSAEPMVQALEPSPTAAPASLTGLVYGVTEGSTGDQAIWQIGQDGDPHVLIPGRTDALFSPDGRRAIYGDNFFETFSGCIWLADSVSGEVKPLECSSGPNEFGEPSIPATVLRWVPNNLDSVYAVIDQSGGGMAGYSGHLGTISLVDGSTTTLDAEHDIQSYEVEISSNGEMIAYGSGIYTPQSGYHDFDPVDYGLEEPYSLSNPSWSADGTKIAWGLLMDNGNYTYSASMGIFDLTNKTSHIIIPPFTPMPGYEGYGPAIPYGTWSPDSQWLALDMKAQNENGEYDPEKSGWWIISVDGAKQYKLDATEFDSWSPDSQWIVYISRAGTDINTLELYASRPDGSEASKLGELDDFYDSKLWSPDRRSLVFVDVNNEVQLADVNGWEVRAITSELGITDASSKIHLIDWIDPLPTSFEGLTSLPTPTPEPVFSCPNAPPTRLHVGDTARITFTDGKTTRLRSAPEAGDNGIANLPEGTEFEIIGGPVCYPRPGRSDAYVYWQVSVSPGGKTGWLAEGDLNSYYLEPWP